MLILIFLLLNIELSTSECHLCKAVETENFKQVEKILRKKLLERKHGDQVNNGKAIYITYNNVYDDLIMWIMKKECVELATWDKCQAKILPYPSYSTMGVIFKTPNKLVEMTFRIREGHSNRLKQRLNARERLYYLSMKKDNGFVRNQISLCNMDKKLLSTNDSALTTDTLKNIYVVPPAIQKFNDTIDYRNILGKYVCIDHSDTVILTEVGNPAALVQMKRNDVEKYSFPIVADGKIKQIGTYSPWRVQIVGIRILQNGDLEAYYSGTYMFDDDATIKFTYRKISTE